MSFPPHWWLLNNEEDSHDAMPHHNIIKLRFLFIVLLIERPLATEMVYLYSSSTTSE